jgi:TP901 family phage tail tape measure protein
MANEWVVKVTADVKGVLDASRQIGQAGKQAGEQFKQGFGGSDQTIEGLRSRLNELTQSLNKAAIGSKEFAAAQKEIAATQREINNALNGFSGKEQTISGLRNRLSELNQSLDKTAIGSRAFKETQREIAQTQRQVDSALAGGTTAMNTFGAAVKGVALQATAFLGLYEAITFVGKAVVELDNAGAAVRTLGSNSKELSSALLDLSSELGNNVSQGELLKSSYDIVSSGFSDTTEVVDILKASVLGATGGFAELGDVTKTVSGIINAYGLTSKDAQGIVDTLVQTQNDGVITVRELSDNIGNVASIAAAAGIPFKELSAAISTATLKGVPVLQTFTGLRQAITSILKPTEEAKTLAKSLGLSFDLASLRAKGFGGFLADVQAKTGGAADKIAILLGSVEAQTAIQPLLNDQLKTYNEQLDNQNNKSGQAAEASKIATETIAGGFNQLVNATKNLAGSVNTALPDASKNFSQFAKVVEIGTKVIVAQGPAINKALSQAFAPFSSLSNIPGFDKIINLGIDGLSRLLGGNKELTTELGKQDQTQAQINAKQEQLKVTAAEILGNKRSQNLEDQVANRNAQQLEEAYNRLARTQIDNQVKISQAGINLGQALIGLEDSRFSIIRSRQDYELQQMQNMGASEEQLAEKRRQNFEIEIEAINFKYQALLQQQELMGNLLTLQQEMARLEAEQAVSAAEINVEKAKLNEEKARLAGDETNTKIAEKDLEIAKLDLTTARAKLDTVSQIQPIVQQTAAANDEAARNAIKAQAAGVGLQQALDGTFQKVKGIGDQFSKVQEKTKLSARSTGFLEEAMRETSSAANAARTQTAGMAANMSKAAGSAQAFYDSLKGASGLPSARFTGGPVDAGQTYRINDGPSGMSLGQESFLSASGALSLINRPMNSLWMAPSKGTVIPAAVTSRLKEAGAMGGAGVLRAGPDPAMAHLAMAVGNLSQEVAELRRKAWNVSVGVRGDGSALKLQQTMQRIR